VTRHDWLTGRPVAHRGYHDRAKGRIENTISAASAAVSRGFAIELDLHLTGDGHLIVFHDRALDRLTEGHGQVDQLSLASLRTARLRGSGEVIPTLDEILEEVAGRVPIFLDLKSTWRGDCEIARQVALALTPYAGPVAVMSFDPNVIAAFRRFSPHVPRGVVSGCSIDLPALPAYARVAYRHLLTAGFSLPDFIAYEVGALPATAPLMFRHATGVPLLAWTVRTTAELAKAHHWADQIIFEGFDPEEQELALEPPPLSPKITVTAEP